MPYPTYTHDFIPGKSPTQILPTGTALVLEGGGTRGFYSAGVFEAFMDAGILFPYIVGVSAGAANAISYISGQQNRNRQVVQHYVGDKRYLSKRNLLLHQSLFNMDFVFHTVPEQHIPIDWNTFNHQNIRFLTGAMNCETGKTVWFEKSDIGSSFEATVASCSIPLVSKIVHYKGMPLLDGGVSDPIPIEKSIQDGNQFHVIVLTQNAGYRKKPSDYHGTLNLFYHRYPHTMEAIKNRYLRYNQQLDLCEQLEKEGKAIIIRPQKPLQIGRTGTDVPKLLALYDEGHTEGAAALSQILKHAQKKTERQ